MALLCLFLHFGQFVLVVEHLKGLVEETISLKVKFLLDLHIESLDLHLQIANNRVLIELIVESVFD